METQAYQYDILFHNYDIYLVKLAFSARFIAQGANIHPAAINPLREQIGANGQAASERYAPRTHGTGGICGGGIG